MTTKILLSFGALISLKVADDNTFTKGQVVTIDETGEAVLASDTKSYVGLVATEDGKCLKNDGMISVAVGGGVANIDNTTLALKVADKVGVTDGLIVKDGDFGLVLAVEGNTARILFK